MRSAPSYGARSRRSAANAGVRLTARTYGKARIGTYAEKADGHITVESDAESLVAHMLCVDPRVRSFRQQTCCAYFFEDFSIGKRRTERMFAAQDAYVTAVEQLRTYVQAQP